MDVTGLYSQSTPTMSSPLYKRENWTQKKVVRPQQFENYSPYFCNIL